MSERSKREVRLFKPSVGDAELARVREVFDRAWLGLGPTVAEFEHEWSEYVGVPDSVAVNSGTAALHLAVGALGLASDSRVLVPALTFVSSASCVLMNGLTPVFVDIDETTLCISLGDLERKYTPDCAAIVVVHFGGQPADMERIMSFARAHGLKVIEDCAHCAGGEHPTLGKLGTIGDFGCFSFEEKKSMTTGDGGMICARDADMLAPLRARRWVGIDKDTWKRQAGYTRTGLDDPRHWHYQIAELGWKYNMNDLAAAIGLAQLKKLDKMNQRRRDVVARYLEGLPPAVRPLLPYDLPGSSYWLFGLRVADRDGFILHMKRNGVATGVHYMPLPVLDLFAGHDEAVPTVMRVWTEFVTLPLFVDITDDEVDYVLESINDFAF